MMSSIHELQQTFSKIESSVLAIGNFDGIHLGHRSIFEQVIQISKSKNVTPLVFVLFPHPKEFFTGSSPALLTTLKDRIEWIQSLGIEKVACLTFDRMLSEVPAQEFLKVVQKNFGLRYLVMGPTTHIGKDRDGTPQKIQEYSKILNFEFILMPQFSLRGCNISSSLIRENILRGEMRWVAEMLGRPYVTRGVVERGAGKGRLIGFPTANIAQIQTMVPARGVYAGYACIHGRKYKSAINVGTRPTVASDNRLVVEAHLIDFNENIVDQDLKIEWIERLREEVKFESVEQLKIQIHRDVQKAKSIL